MFGYAHILCGCRRAGVLCLLLGALFAEGVCLLAQTPRNPDSSSIAEITGALRGQDFNQALLLTGKALRVSPGDSRIWTLRGMAYSGAGKNDLAVAAYMRALKTSPNYLPALEGAAQVEYLQGNSAAKSLLERLLKLQPSDPTGHAMLASIDYRAKNCRGAVAHFAQAGDALANQPRALAEYGMCLAELKRFSDAAPVFQRALDLEPANDAARFNLALDQWDEGKADDALETIQSILPDPSIPEDALTLAADIYESKGESQKAVDLLRRAILTYPKDKNAYLDFANLSYDHASVQVGIDMLNAGLTQLPQDAEMHLSRGMLYCKLGDMTKCMADLETADRLNPDLPFVGAATGIAESQAHNPAAAIEIFRARLRQHPDNALTQYLLAEALMGKGEAAGSPAFREEVQAAKRAIKLDPGFTAARDLLATIELQAGELQSAIDQSEAALRIDPKDQRALYHLILAKRRTGNRAEASALLARFSEVRREAQEEDRKVRLYPLVEEPSQAPANASR